jgi:hypothetical protein
MASLFDWSSTASSNTTLDSINVNTGMSPANVDNSIRSLMALVRNSFASALQSFLAGTAALPIANGGTGATSASAALTALNGLDASYRDLPRVDKASSFTFSNTERSDAIWISGTGVVATINPDATTPINPGAVYMLMNGHGTSSFTVVRGSGVKLYVNGATPTGNGADATVAPGGVATLTRWGTDYWTITGAGVS